MEDVGGARSKERGFFPAVGAPGGSPVPEYGLMAEWLCRGLQNRERRFDSGSGLQFPRYAAP